MMTDPIADMLTRIRNAQMVKKEAIEVPYSKIKHAIADILEREGRLVGVEKIAETSKAILRLQLKYVEGKKPAIYRLRRLSTPGRRQYASKDAIPRALGFVILSTSQGIMTDREARKIGIGGEVICEID